MKHLFLPYQLALLAKQNSFNEPCGGAFKPSNKEFYYLDFHAEFTNSNINKGHITAPLYQQIITWFMNKHLIYIIQLPSPMNVYSVYKQKDIVVEATEICSGLSIDKAIEEAFNMINQISQSTSSDGCAKNELISQRSSCIAEELIKWTKKNFPTERGDDGIRKALVKGAHAVKEKAVELLNKQYV